MQRAPSGVAYTLAGYINGDNLLDRVETWVDHPIIGDLHHEFFYSNYQRFDGVMVPARVSQKQVGMETFVAAINSGDGSGLKNDS